MQVPTDLTTYKRVLQLAETPTTEQFKQTAFVAAAGVGLVGSIGFFIFTFFYFLP